MQLTYLGLLILCGSYSAWGHKIKGLDHI